MVAGSVHRNLPDRPEVISHRAKIQSLCRPGKLQKKAVPVRARTRRKYLGKSAVESIGAGFALPVKNFSSSAGCHVVMNKSAWLPSAKVA
jgi:hypothetical protein